MHIPSLRGPTPQPDRRQLGTGQPPLQGAEQEGQVGGWGEAPAFQSAASGPARGPGALTGREDLNFPRVGVQGPLVCPPERHASCRAKRRGSAHCPPTSRETLGSPGAHPSPPPAPRATREGSGDASWTASGQRVNRKAAGDCETLAAASRHRTPARGRATGGLRPTRRC